MALTTLFCCCLAQCVENSLVLLLIIREDCQRVADKYVEYELVVVLLDLVLHRVAAYRHLYRNRHDLWKVNNFSTWLFLLVIMLNAGLKSVVLHIAHHEVYFDSRNIAIYLLIAVLEYAVLFAGYLAAIILSKEDRQHIKRPSSRFRMYLALSFPELLKLIALCLQLFDCTPMMLLLLGLLIMSMQHCSVASVVNISPKILLVGSLLSVLLKIGIRFIAHSSADVRSLGLIV